MTMASETFKKAPKQSLLRQAYSAAKNSYAPYSHQQHGAAIQTASGATYIGCTVDNAAYPNSACAIRNAVNNAISSELGKNLPNPFQPKIVACAYINLNLATEQYAIPCGVSCQSLVEHGDFPVYLGKSTAKQHFEMGDELEFKETSVLQLMPFAEIHGVKDLNRYAALKQSSDELHVETVITGTSLEADETVVTLAKAAVEASKYAYVPYSHFPVGASILTDQGIITGCNIENASFQVTSCGERTALSNAVAAGAQKLSAMAVVCTKLKGEFAQPCGGCRQSLVEFGNFPVYCLKHIGEGLWCYSTRMTYDILPGAFLPSSLT